MAPLSGLILGTGIGSSLNFNGAMAMRELDPRGDSMRWASVLTGRHSQSRFASKGSSVHLLIAKRNLEAEYGPYCSHG